MELYRKERGRKLVFIHGKGEGVLRQRIIGELKAHYPQCRWQDASFREYGFGATLVTVREGMAWRLYRAFLDLFSYAS